jgi:hypothetical protein
MARLPRRHPEALCRASRDFSIEALAEGPVADLVTAALAAAAVPSQRSSPLQPRFVVWFVLCRALFPADSLMALFNRLCIGLRGRIRDLPVRAVTDSGLCHARERLGFRFFMHLLQLLAGIAPEMPRFHGFRVRALDGARMDVADTRANRKAFGRPRCGHGSSSWPQVLALVLFDVRSMIPIAARFVRRTLSEKVVGRQLLRHLDGEDLLLLDGGFYGIPFLRAVTKRNARFLCPVPRHVKFRRVRRVRLHGRLRDYDASMYSRLPLRNGRTRATWLAVRVIEIDLPGLPTRRFVTNLPEHVPATEILAVYDERWTAEMAFDDIKTVLCHAPAGAAPILLRSKSPDGVRQEAYALLCTYSIIRRTMAMAAARVDLSPRDLSFTDSARLIALAAPVMLGAPAARLPELYAQLLDDIAAQRLRRPKTPRRCPREARRKGPKYRIKRTTSRRVA